MQTRWPVEEWRRLRNEGHTFDQIASAFECSKHTVRDWLSGRYGARRASPEMIAYYQQGRTFTEVGDHFGLSYQRVYALLIASGVPVPGQLQPNLARIRELGRDPKCRCCGERLATWEEYWDRGDWEARSPDNGICYQCRMHYFGGKDKGGWIGRRVRHKGTGKTGRVVGRTAWGALVVEEDVHRNSGMLVFPEPQWETIEDDEPEGEG